MKLMIKGKSLTVTAQDSIGKGGEADVYDLHNGLAVKVFKVPTDPDYANDPVAQQGAKARIEEQQRKLPAFPTLPNQVVAPVELAYNGTKKIAGYTMEYLKNCEVLLRYSDRRFREQGGIDPNDVIGLFRDLALAVANLHTQEVIIGDFNDLNVLVDGNIVRLIDADSMQFGSFYCHTFTPRFLDPLHSGPSKLGLARALDENSDWYAYAVMLFQALLYVSPYGGVHKPKSGSRLQHDARVLQRLTVFNPEVIYPKPALPYGYLPDDLLDYFHRVFEKDTRGPFPGQLLHNLQWTTCTACGTVHARPVCPACKTAFIKTPVLVRGVVRAQRVFSTEGQIVCAVHQGQLRYLYHTAGAFFREGGRKVADGELSPDLRYRISGTNTVIARRDKMQIFPDKGGEDIDSYGHLPVVDANSAYCYWVNQSGQLRASHLSNSFRVSGIYLGDVLPGRTLIWTGEKFGFGFYRAGSILRAFVFDSEGMNDQVEIPDFKGELVDTTCVFSDKRCWFFATLQVKGRLWNHIYVLDARGKLYGFRSAEQSDENWLAYGIRGRFPVGQSLYVPTDEGIMRIDESDLSSPAKTFPDTTDFVDGSSYLLAGDGGIYVVGTNEITLLTIS